MAEIKSQGYYKKCCTSSMIQRMSGTSPSQVLGMVKAGILVPDHDPYTGFKLFSPEDGDIAKFARYCVKELRFNSASMPYLIGLLREMLPDYTWQEIQQAMEAVAKLTVARKYTVN